MNLLPHAVAVLAGRAANAAPYDVLARFGLKPLLCDGAAQLYARLAGGEAQACVLDATEHRAETLAMVAQLRGSLQAGIVVVTPPAALEDRIHALLVGADACVPASPDPRELAAALLALYRRRTWAARATPGLAEAFLASPAAGAIGMEPMAAPGIAAPAVRSRPPWRCRDHGWQLMAPNGNTVRLSANERLMVMLLGRKAGEVVSREELTAALARQQPASPEDPCTAPDARAGSINMLVSRLRKKARRTGMRLEIETAPGRGYLLTSTLLGVPETG